MRENLFLASEPTMCRTRLTPANHTASRSPFKNPRGRARCGRYRPQRPFGFGTRLARSQRAASLIVAASYPRGTSSATRCVAGGGEPATYHTEYAAEPLSRRRGPGVNVRRCRNLKRESSHERPSGPTMRTPRALPERFLRNSSGRRTSRAICQSSLAVMPTGRVGRLTLVLERTPR